MSVLDRLRPSNGHEAPPDSSLTQDELHTMLAYERRRLVIRMVAAHGRKLGTLADRITDHEVTGRGGSDERQAVYIALYQSHIPKLEKTGVVRVRDGDTITAGPNHAAAMYAMRATAPVTIDGGAPA